VFTAALGDLVVLSFTDGSLLEYLWLQKRGDHAGYRATLLPTDSISV
jgi:hypothetical protein